jgi:predicted AAA+ superfamily ATPase
MFFPRTLSETLKNASATFPVVLLTGPRQVGKTTLLGHCADATRNYVTLDDPAERLLAKTDPALFLQKHSAPLLIDEVQYAPELFPFIKIAADRQRGENGLFWLAGSQQFRLMRGVSESLAERVAILELQGFSQAERFRRPARPFIPGDLPDGKPPPLEMPALYELILTGAFPVPNLAPATNRHLFYSSYLKTYLERDVRDLLRVGDENVFLKFLRAAAASTGQLLNYSSMARDVDVSVNTIKSWVSILETSGLVFLLQPWYNNRVSRAVKTPKLYFLDTGLCCHLSGWETAATLSVGAMSGAILETYAISEILKSHWHCGRQPRVWFYRDKEQREIDLLIERDGQLLPVEIKRTAAPGKRDIRHFAAIDNAGPPRGHGALLCFYENMLPLDERNDVVPFAMLG